MCQVLSDPHLRQVHDRALQLADSRQHMTFQDELRLEEMDAGERDGQCLRVWRWWAPGVGDLTSAAARACQRAPSGLGMKCVWSAHGRRAQECRASRGRADAATCTGCRVGM